MNKQTGVHLYNGILDIKRNELLICAITLMNFFSFNLFEREKAVRDRERERKQTLLSAEPNAGPNTVSDLQP